MSDEAGRVEGRFLFLFLFLTSETADSDLWCVVIMIAVCLSYQKRKQEG